MRILAGQTAAHGVYINIFDKYKRVTSKVRGIHYTFISMIYGKLTIFFFKVGVNKDTLIIFLPSHLTYPNTRCYVNVKKKRKRNRQQFMKNIYIGTKTKKERESTHKSSEKRERKSTYGIYANKRDNADPW